MLSTASLLTVPLHVAAQVIQSVQGKVSFQELEILALSFISSHLGTCN